MTGDELFSKIILSLNSYLGLNDLDLIDYIEIDENLDEAFQWFIMLSPVAPFDTFLKSLEKIKNENAGNFRETPYSILGATSFIDFNQPKFASRNRRFAYSNVNFSFASSKALFDDGSLIDLSDGKYLFVWKQIEEFLERIFSAVDNAAINRFFDIIRNFDSNTGLVVNKTGTPFNEDNHYPYIYLAFLNDSKSIFLSTQLKYHVTQLFPSLTYDNTKNYDQYFDIFDVLNELNQAPDILNRFLRLYHTMEYLVYRVYLVNLVSRVGASRLFVREFITSAESMKKGERESFIKNFRKIFVTDLVGIIEPNITPTVNAAVTTFLADHKIVFSFSSNNIDKIAELIYGLRCCIVHNKESEYHMTISNADDYQIIIPVIKKLLEIFESLVVDKVSSNHATINYTQKSVNLY